MSKHTPGPWEWGTSNYALWTRNERPGRGNCILESYPDGELRVSCSNARLIAAAPDLLKAAKMVNPAIDSILGEYISKKGATNWGLVNDTLMALGTAIAKADGK